MFLLLLLSFGSGAAALIYEVVWFQMLELEIGSTVISLAVILTTFMGGMGLGSLLFPRYAPLRFPPLRTYASMEAGIGIFGLLALFAIPLAGGVYAAWAGSGAAGFLLRGLAAGACLLGPAMLMGATFPALSRAVAEPSQIGWLYAGNLAGAVAGCLTAGFYLLREFDVATATWFAVGLNLLTAAGAVAASGTPVRTPPPNEATGKPDPRVYFAIAISGACALAGETIWTRTLGLLFGPSAYTFSIILAVFLTGLAIGSALGSFLCRVADRPRAALGWCQLLAAASIAWAAYATNAALPQWPVNPELATGIWANFQLDLARAFWALLPPTIFWGASFPLALAAAGGRKDAAEVAPGVYAANTFGAILGAMSASLVLVAWLGSQRAQQIVIALSVIAGLALLTKRVVLPALAAAGFLLWMVPPIDPLLIAHGRYAATWTGRGDVLYAEEGLNASVAVMGFAGSRTFHVGGKIQASDVPRDLRLQRMLGHLTTLTAANPRSVLVIGCGAGVTAGAVSLDPRVEREIIVEIEPLVPIAAEAYFARPNFSVIRNPKVNVRIDDGRHFLLTSQETYDAITIDPLDPWAKGAASLYTREFLESLKRHLNPGGTATVYVQLFETNADAVRSLMATFFEVFPGATLWGNTYEGKGYDLVLLGTNGPLRIDLDAIGRQLESSEFASVSRSLAEVGMDGAAGLFSNYAGRAADLKEWVRGAAINRDRNLRMQYLAGFGLNRDDSAAIYADILRYRQFPRDLFAGDASALDVMRR